MGKIQQAREEWELRKSALEAAQTILDNKIRLLEEAAVARYGVLQLGSKTTQQMPEGREDGEATGYISDLWVRGPPKVSATAEAEMRVRRLKQMLKQVPNAELPLLDHLLRELHESEQILHGLDQLENRIGNEKVAP